MALQQFIYEHVGCPLESCNGSKFEIQVGEEVQITLEQKNPDWQTPFLAEVISVTRTPAGRDYLIQYDNVVLGESQVAFDGCDVRSIEPYCCCQKNTDDISDLKDAISEIQDPSFDTEIISDLEDSISEIQSCVFDKETTLTLSGPFSDVNSIEVEYIELATNTQAQGVVTFDSNGFVIFVDPDLFDRFTAGNFSATLLPGVEILSVTTDQVVSDRVTVTERNVCKEIDNENTFLTIIDNQDGTASVTNANGTSGPCLKTCDDVDDNDITSIIPNPDGSHSVFRNGVLELIIPTGNNVTLIPVSTTDYTQGTTVVNYPDNPNEGNTAFQDFQNGRLFSTYDSDSGTWIEVFTPTGGPQGTFGDRNIVTFQSTDDFDNANPQPPSDYSPSANDSEDGDEVIVRYDNGWVVSWKWDAGVLVNEIILGNPDSFTSQVVDPLTGEITYTLTIQPETGPPVVTTWTTGGAGGGGSSTVGTSLVTTSTNTNDATLAATDLTQNHTQNWIGEFDQGGATSLSAMQDNVPRQTIIQQTGSPQARVFNVSHAEWHGNKLYVDATQQDDGGTRGRPDEPFPSIQDAIDSAETGDLVVVRAGVYSEVSITLKDQVDLYFEQNTTYNGDVISDIGNDPNGPQPINASISGFLDMNALNGFRFYEGSIVNIELDGLWREGISTAARTLLDVRGDSEVRLHVRERFDTEGRAVIMINGKAHLTGIAPTIQNSQRGDSTAFLLQDGSELFGHFTTKPSNLNENPVNTAGGISHSVIAVRRGVNRVEISAPGFVNKAPFLELDATNGGGIVNSGAIISYDNGTAASTSHVELTSWGESETASTIMSRSNDYSIDHKLILRGGSWVQTTNDVAPFKDSEDTQGVQTRVLAVESITRNGNTGAVGEVLSDHTVAGTNRTIIRQPFGHNYIDVWDINTNVVAEVIPNAAVYDINFE